ncbi:MAG TPA: hypothetical protein VD999_07790 [Vitreimonas sp.]|nr:hypothetical protein [Vitreimonas sp.]
MGPSSTPREEGPFLGGIMARKPKNRADEKYEVSGVVITQTGKAILVETDTKQEWIPLSQVHQIDKVNKKIFITPFIAKRLGLYI